MKSPAQLWDPRMVRMTRALAITAVVVVFATALAQAQSFSYLTPYSFTGAPNAQGSYSGFTLDAAGNFYGTSSQGGASGLGTVYKIDASGKETVLHSFTGIAGDGAQPEAPVVFDGQGNLYGTTYAGGDTSCNSPTGCGTVFKLDPLGNETILHTFEGGSDGANPLGNLAMDGEGNLYGSATGGGTNFVGLLFRVTTSGVEAPIYQFECCTAVAPQGVIIDGAGNLYGLSSVGGTGHGQECGDFGCGTLLEVTKGLTLIVLHNFDPSVGDGGRPNGALIRDSQGNFYGTTPIGGYEFKHRPTGSGMVFKIDAEGNETALHVFCMAGHDGQPGAFCADGAYPNGMVMDGASNLYGTTSNGGAHGGNGTIFMIDSLGNESSLFNFEKSKNTGNTPAASLAIDSEGNFWGTTSQGGTNNMGVMFAMLTPSAAATNTLTSTPNPSTAGEAVTFTTVIQSLTGGRTPPDGETVTFMSGKTVLGTGSLTGGTASFTTSTLKTGKVKVTAAWGGDPHFISAGSNTVIQVVQKLK